MELVWIYAYFLIFAMGNEMLVTKSYTDYLKKHVEWDVVDYDENIFKGWTIEEAKVILGDLKTNEDIYKTSGIEMPKKLPSSINWSGGRCEHEVRYQGNCGSAAAFGVANMLSDRCCLNGKDHGWLSPQEIVSCDKKSDGCKGGWSDSALNYSKTVHGLVPESCFPYKAKDLRCPKVCEDGKNWQDSHVCECQGEYRTLRNEEEIKAALANGPVVLAFDVCRSLFNYKAGIYKCDCTNYIGIMTILAVAYKTTSQGQCYYVIKFPWSTTWGMRGFLEMFCNTCGISGKYPKGDVVAAINSRVILRLISLNIQL